MHATVNAYTVISSPACVIPRPKLSLIWLNIPTGIYSVELKVKAAKHSVTTLIQGLYLDRFNAGGHLDLSDHTLSLRIAQKDLNKL